EMAADSGVRTIGLLSGEDKSTAKSSEELLPHPRKEASPELLPPPRDLREGTAGGSAATGDAVPCRPLTLADAVALSFQLQPPLRAALETIEQAAGRQDVVRAAFLPVATTGYHVGGFDLNAGGLPIQPQVPGLQSLAQNFNFIPFTGTLPIGFDVKTGY